MGAIQRQVASFARCLDAHCAWRNIPIVERKALWRNRHSIASSVCGLRSVALPSATAVRRDGSGSKLFSGGGDNTAANSDSSPSIALIGIPLDANSSFLRGPAEGPDAIRRVLHSGSGNSYTEHGVDALSALDDLGNIGGIANVAGSTSDADLITDRVASIIGGTRAPVGGGRLSGPPDVHGDARTPRRLISLGGDHSVTYPILRGVRRFHDPSRLTVVHVDAHPDLYDDLDGSNRLSHASPFARALEDGCMSRLVQVGVRTATPHQRRQAARWGVETVSPRRLGAAAGASSLDDALASPIEGPVYLTIDLDGIDPSEAPGVSHHEPGGLTVLEVLDVVDALAPLPIVAADIVELNPSRDVEGMTAAVAAKLLKEVAGAMLTAAAERQ